MFKLRIFFILIGCFLMFPLVFNFNQASSIFPQTITQPKNEFEWKQKVTSLWEQISSYRANQEVSPKNSHQRKQPDNLGNIKNHQMLLDQLDQLATEGAKHNFSIRLAESNPLKKVDFPGLSPKEIIYGGPDQNGQQETQKKLQTGVITRGNPVISIDPAYSGAAAVSNLQGDVEVVFTVSKTGKVVNASCTAGHPLFHQAALSAISQYRFQPTLLNNEPINFVAKITFRFQR